VRGLLMKKIIEKAKFADFVGTLLSDYEVFAPVKNENGLVLFSRISSPEEIFLDFRNSKKPPKEFLFPQVETLFEYEPGKVKVPSVEAIAQRRLFLCVRPCDVKSFLILDEVFDTEEFQDVYYVTRRRNTTILAMGCVDPPSTCFCTTFDEMGPFSREGADAFLVDIGDRFLIETLTERGESLPLESLPDASDEDVQTAEDVEKKAVEKVDRKLELSKLGEKLDGMFESPFWDALHEKCLTCGVCTYLCPTCHCFDISDEALDSKGRRVRNWDSCMFPLFTLQASGHNPRPTSKERMRQRIMHKFNYFYKNYGVYACVGCGRCVENCPVNLDIRKVLEGILSL